MRLIVLTSIVATAFFLAACSTSRQVAASKEVLNSSARAVIGTSLVGAKGKTPADQDKIDTTAARVCGAKVWTKAECQRHGVESM